MAKKIVLTGGGTAGHCYPNLALVPMLRSMGYEITYIGSSAGIESSLVADEGISYFGISSGKLRRYFDIRNFTDPFRVIKGFAEARHILKVLSPDIVFSKGGYVSAPVVRAAGSLGIPVVCHESDMTPGLANKMSYGAASKICCSFKDTLSMLPKDKGVFTGSPIRSSLLEGDAARAQKFVGLQDNGLPCLLVTGGSSGARNVNDAVRSALPLLTKSYNVIHLSGKGKTDPTLDRMPGYTQYEYVSGEMKDLYALADIVISRAGSNSIFELLALAKPNILIPLTTSGSRGDQILNAGAFEKAGYSRLLKEEELNPGLLLETVNEVFKDRDRYVSAMKSAPENDAVSKICETIDKVVNDDK